MNDMSGHGELTAPRTLTIQRVLPGPVERIWRYITESELRAKWLASGDMVLEPGAPFTFIWRNDTLSDPPGKRPEGWPEEHRMEQHVIAVDPPHRLVFGWAGGGEVSMELKPRTDGKVLLTVVHSGLPGRPGILDIASGWHTHLDILLARLSGEEPQSFWDYWQRLRPEYDQRLPGLIRRASR